MNMFCYQCEQTAQGQGCTKIGACGKDPTAAALQDIIVYQLKGISMYAHRARKLGKADKEIDTATIEGLFETVTNVNFDVDRLQKTIQNLVSIRNKAKALYQQAGGSEDLTAGPANFAPADNLEGLVAQATEVSIAKRKETIGDDLTALQELLIYGIKGAAAYADHAQILEADCNEVYAYFHKALNYLSKDNSTIEDLLGLNLECGAANLKIMEILDKAHTDHFGHPEPTPVRITPKQGKAILVSGHDLKDLEDLLKQTEGKGINIYTHGEMLPAHSYPALKKYGHLAGNYGGAWQDQQAEFDAFPGAILMTTNCIIKPKDSYKDRIFTKGCVGWPGVKHLTTNDYRELITAAQNAAGFSEDGEDKTILVGFGHNAVLSVADKVVEAVKGGNIKHFFLVGGCDGAKSGRNYYTEFAEKVPQDCVILTLACGKYRFNKMDFGNIGGIPRLLDIGQCNDAYSAIQIAVALSKAFDMEVNDLPLSMIISWFEQKAVAILLTLLHLGIKNIRLGPTLPAFVTPTVLNVLVEKFNIMPISEAEKDLQDILGTPVK